VPLTRIDTLRALLQAAGDGGMALLTAELADPSGYGRIVRDAAGRVTRIVEHKDASEAERAIREIKHRHPAGAGGAPEAVAGGPGQQ